MYDIDTNFVDTLYDGRLQQNWLFFLGGVNDIGSGVSGAVTFGRLTNYVAARKCRASLDGCCLHRPSR